MARGWFAPILLFPFGSNVSDQQSIITGWWLRALATAFQLYPSLAERMSIHPNYDRRRAAVKPACSDYGNAMRARGKAGVITAISNPTMRTTDPRALARHDSRSTSHRPTITGIDRRISSHARSEHQVNSVSLTRNLHHACGPLVARELQGQRTIADLSGTHLPVTHCV